MKTIAETVIGLKTYEDSKIDEKKLQEYVEYTESHNNPKLSFWACFCAVVLFVINIYGLQLKNEYKGEYQVRKVVESFYRMKAIDQKNPGVQQITISNKKELYNYLLDDFSEIFFTEGMYVQEQMRIVGPVRLRTIHTVRDECKIKTQLSGCYQDDMNQDQYLFKEDIDGIKFQSCEDIGISHNINGE